MVSVLVPSVVDRVFIGDVMVSVLASSVVDRGFIGDVMVSVLVPSLVDRGFIVDVMVIVLVPSVVDRQGDYTVTVNLSGNSGSVTDSSSTTTTAVDTVKPDQPAFDFVGKFIGICPFYAISNTFILCYLR
jgi:hypothetical protein